MADVHKNLLCQMVMDRQVYYAANLPSECFPAELRAVYRAIKERYDRGSDVDLVLLHEDLPNIPASELSRILDAVPSSANWRYYAAEVRKAWREERLRKLALELQDRTQDPGAVEWAYEELGKLADAEQTEIHQAPKMVVEFVGVVEERYHNRGRLPGIATGIGELDNMLLGLKPRLLYYIGARPSDGKTALIVTLIANICRQGIPVGLMSIESSRKEIMARLFANTGNINNQSLITGSLSRADFERIQNTASRVHEWPLTICDRENMELNTIRAKAREMVRVHGARALFLDYIQLVPQTDAKQPFRLHMGEVSMALKQLARELEVPVVVAAQLGRNAEGKEPTLADFKESGQLEQDADAAILIHHHEEHGSRLIVAKNKDGPRGKVQVTFHKAHMRFTGEQAELEVTA
jgi:replicative DNA helicase